MDIVRRAISASGIDHWGYPRGMARSAGCPLSAVQRQSDPHSVRVMDSSCPRTTAIHQTTIRCAPQAAQAFARTLGCLLLLDSFRNRIANFLCERIIRRGLEAAGNTLRISPFRLGNTCAWSLDI